MSHDLEAPGTDEIPDWDSLYRARGAEVVAHRPFFTGDVFSGVRIAGERDSRNVIILQHPCAIRTGGVKLVGKLVMAEVRPLSPLIPPSNWTTGHYRCMPLPLLIVDDKRPDHSARFDAPHLATPEQLQEASRIACLSQKGVNLLLQRWVHHNSRVVVPTYQYQTMTAAQYEEADMIEDWCADRADDGIEASDALLEVDEWLSVKDTQGGSRRDALKDEQQRSTLRRDLRAHLRWVRSAPTEGQ